MKQKLTKPQKETHKPILTDFNNTLSVTDKTKRKQVKIQRI